MKSNEAESCELNKSVAALNTRVDRLETRIASVEKAQQSGFNAINSNIETLSQMLTNMDARLINDREKWHDVFRSIVKWTIRTGLGIIAYAAGVNLTKSILPFFN